MTPRELGRVLDYPEERIQEMTEEQLSLLTTNEEIPGKILYSALFSVSTLEPSLDLEHRAKNQNLNQVKIRDSKTLNPDLKFSDQNAKLSGSSEVLKNSEGRPGILGDSIILSHGYGPKGPT